ncbi:MAG: hypothetical protein HN423_03155, partial [Alphaproteobacteria bacterium]|nr:hypothetical protein [Alphaproteobacteria bacterium]
MSVITMGDAGVLSNQTVTVENRRITRIGPSEAGAVPTNAFTVDGTGKFLMPGLSDMMTHTNGVENDLLVYLANGVTTIRIMGLDPPAIFQWRDEIAAGLRVGPNISVMWPMTEATLQEFVWGAERATRGGRRWARTPEEAEQLVVEAKKAGADGIKSHGQPTEVFVALLESAKKHGLTFDGHAPDDHIFCQIRDTCAYENPTAAWNDYRAMNAGAIAHVEELIKMVELLDPETREASPDSIRHMAQDVADDGLWVST